MVDSVPPSLVIALGPAMKVCAQQLRVAYIKQEMDDLKRKCDKWLQVYNHEYYSNVGKSALSEVAKSKWDKPRFLPLMEDIIKLNK